MFKRWSHFLYVLVLIISPLAFGTTEYWSMALAQFLCALSLLMFVVELKNDTSLQLVKVPGLSLLLALLALLCFQLIPLPPALLQLLSPTTAAIYQQSVYVLDPNAWLPLAVHVQSAVFELLRFISCITIYFLTVQYFTALSSLKKLLQWLTWFLGGYAFLSLMQYLIPSDYIFWFVREWPLRRPHAFGTYVNGNHYSGLIEMMLPLVIALFLVSRPRVSYLTWRQKVVEFFKCPAASQYIWIGVVVVLLASTVFLSLSRGGILSCTASVMAFTAVLLVKTNNRKSAIIILLLIMVVFVLVGSAGWDPVFDRFDRVTNSAGELNGERMVYWRDSLNIIKDYPLFGSGSGSFVDIYRHYRSTVNTTYIVDHAHNDYIEFLVTLGSVGAVLLACFFIRLFRHTHSIWRRRKNGFSNLMWLGSMFGLLAILLHSVTDFNLFIGANAFYFFAVCGIAVAAATGQGARGGPSYTQPMNHTASRLLLAVLTLGLCIGTAFNGLASYVDGRYEEIAQQDIATLDSHHAQQLDAQLATLQCLMPWDARLPFAQANIAQANIIMTQQNLPLAESYTQRALELRPLNGEYAQALGLLRSYQGQQQQASTLLQAGLDNDPTQAQYYLTYITWLLTAQRNSEAIPTIQAALIKHPSCFDDILILFALYDLNDQDLHAVLPEQSRIQVKFGDYLLQRDNEPLAEQVFRHAVELSLAELRPSTQAVWRLHRLYRKRGDTQSGIALLNNALITFPADASMRGNLASLYEREGISYRALEEYQQAHLLDPSKEWIKKGLQRLQR